MIQDLNDKFSPHITFAWAKLGNAYNKTKDACKDVVQLTTEISKKNLFSGSKESTQKFKALSTSGDQLTQLAAQTLSHSQEQTPSSKELELLATETTHHLSQIIDNLDTSLAATIQMANPSQDAEINEEIIQTLKGLNYTVSSDTNSITIENPNHLRNIQQETKNIQEEARFHFDLIQQELREYDQDTLDIVINFNPKVQEAIISLLKKTKYHFSLSQSTLSADHNLINISTLKFTHLKKKK